MLSQHEVGSEIVSNPALQQRGNGRTELVEEITQPKALLRVERNVSHAAGVYGRPTRVGINAATMSSPSATSRLEKGGMTSHQGPRALFCPWRGR